MKTKIFLNGQEFSEDWPGQFSVKRRVSWLTNKYIYELNKLNIDGEVTFIINSENEMNAEENDMDFNVDGKTKSEEDKIWDIIIKVKNNIKIE